MAKLTVKVGDLVLVRQNGWHLPVIRVVEHVTTLHFEDNTGMKWCYDGGSCPKANRDKWHLWSIAHATPDDIAAVQRAHLRNTLLERVRHCRWKDLSTDVLARIVEIVEKEAKRA